MVYSMACLKKIINISLVILFVLLISATDAESIRFVVTGDSRGDDNGVNTAILSEIVQATIVEGADFIIFAGDLVSGSSSPAVLESQLTTWKNIMAPLYEAGIGVFPCRGNHDASGKAAWDRAFSGTYTLPQNGPLGEKSITYSFSWENVFIVILDQYGLHPGRVNQEWLDEELALNSQPHVFVSGHQPAFAVYHSGCLDDYPRKRNIFWRSLANAGGRTYFAGHDHLYNHALIDDGDNDDENDLHQFIAGTAGAPLYEWDGSYDGRNSFWTPELVSYESAYGYILVEVEGLEVTLTWKHRAAPNVYEPGGDQFTYSAEPLSYESD
jgi:predicted phosphodiesterase